MIYIDYVIDYHCWEHFDAKMTGYDQIIFYLYIIYHLLSSKNTLSEISYLFVAYNWAVILFNKDFSWNIEY